VVMTVADFQTEGEEKLFLMPRISSTFRFFAEIFPKYFKVSIISNPAKANFKNNSGGWGSCYSVTR
jgi:hypothetical protein